MRPHARHRLVAIAGIGLVGVIALVAGLTAARAVLFPRTDSPEQVDAIVVVAGAQDDRYIYARQLADGGVTDHILVSQPQSSTGPYATALDSYCATNPVTARDGRLIEVECFAPDVDTTEGETTAAIRTAQKMGYDSLLVITYWGHVSRVRLYFEQCFDGVVNVTDTPRPLSKSRQDALLHEMGGYTKALLSPAC